VRSVFQLSPYLDKAIDSLITLWQGNATIKTGGGTGPQMPGQPAYLPFTSDQSGKEVLGAKSCGDVMCLPEDGSSRGVTLRTANT